MKVLLPVLMSGIGILAVWIFDAAILSYYRAGATVFTALWGDASFLRIIFRIVISVLIFLPGFEKTYGLWQSRNVLNVWQGGCQENLYRGSAESSNKSCRMLYYSMILAKHFKMNTRQRSDLRTLCFCYNVGKIDIPNYLIMKKGDLSENEKKIWDRYLETGAEIIKSIPELASASSIMRYHREYYNGGGPLGVAGKKIPLACRIFQVVWMFDCMIYPQGHHRPLVFDEALLELRYYAGSALDADVVEAFIKIMGRKSIFQDAGGRVFSWR